MFTERGTKTRNPSERKAGRMKETILGEATNELIIAFVAILSTIGTAFVAARRSAENANRIAEKTFDEVRLLREALASKSAHDNERYMRIQAELADQSRRMEAMRTDLDMVRGALGTRKEDHYGDPKTV